MPSTLPVPSGADGGLSKYLRDIRRFPVLTAEEEFAYAKRWQEHQDVDAAHQMVTSHLRLVAKMALGFRHYGLPLADLISEGNLGLMRAVKKFDPDKGFRLATYAMWWIKAALHEYVLNSWSLVRFGTLAAHKKLFFNLRRVKARLRILESNGLTEDDVERIAEELRRAGRRSADDESAHRRRVTRRSMRRLRRMSRSSVRISWSTIVPIRSDARRSRGDQARQQVAE